MLKTIRDIIQNHPLDLPLQYSVSNDKISVEKKKRYYIERRSINIPKHDLSIVRIKKEHFKGRILFETHYDTHFTYHIKYQGEIIHINGSQYNVLDYRWYENVKGRRIKKQQKGIMNTIRDRIIG